MLPDSAAGWRSSINIFDDIDFSILYDWLPQDIEAVIQVVLAFLLVLAVLGLVKHFLLR